jgi:hypothetical protein
MSKRSKRRYRARPSRALRRASREAAKFGEISSIIHETLTRGSSPALTGRFFRAMDPTPGHPRPAIGIAFQLSVSATIAARATHHEPGDDVVSWPSGFPDEDAATVRKFLTACAAPDFHTAYHLLAGEDGAREAGRVADLVVGVFITTVAFLRLLHPAGVVLTLQGTDRIMRSAHFPDDCLTGRQRAGR